MTVTAHRTSVGHRSPSGSSPLRVVIEATRLLDPGARHSGIARFSDALVSGLVDEDDFEIWLAVRKPADGWPDSHQASYRKLRRRLSGRIFSYESGGEGKEFQDRLGVLTSRDLFHSTHLPLPGRKIVGRATRLITVHDVLHLKFPEMYKGAQPPRIERVIRSIGGDDWVACDSEQTRRDYLSLVERSADRVQVIPLGAELPPPADVELLPQQPYLLALLQVEPRKNLSATVAGIAEGLSNVGDEDTLIRLVVNASTRRAALEAAWEAGIPPDRLMLDESPPAEHLALLYAGASAFVFGSTYEGFGLPPLEALSHGTPTVAVMGSSLIEVLGDSVVWATSGEKGAIAEAVGYLLGSETLRSEVGARGRARAGSFTWDKVVDRYGELYRQMVSESGKRRGRAPELSGRTKQPVDRLKDPRYEGSDPHMSPEELERLRSLEGAYAGERIFVIGNGPSLNKMDLELLADEHTFCLNRISLLFDRVSWRPSFFTAFDTRVVPDNLDELNELDIPYKFFAMKHKGAIRDRENHIWYHDRQTADDFENRFSGSPEVTGFGGGGTVTCCAIQIASYLGFDPIILIGCDASYSVPSSVIQAGPDQFGDGVKLNLESTQDDDPNHFDPSYFGKGKRWHSPNAAEMHVGFEKTYRLMSRLGLTLVNATVGGALDSVPRVDYERLFETKGSRPPHPRIGIDLTHETAAKQHGMRNSLMATLRNTALMGTDIEFVAFRGADERYDYYDGLGSVRNFTVLTEGDRGFEEAATSLDALLSPFNDLSTSLPIGSDTKRIAYVNDLIPLNHSGFPETTRSRYEETVEGADAIVCLSDATREELSDRFGIDEQDCFTAPPAIDEDLTVTPVSEDFELVSEEEIAAVRRKVGVRDTYLVYPAAFRPHKNHERLFEAMRYTYTMLQLVLTTGESHDHPATRRIQAEIDSRNMSHRILVAGHLSAQDYRALLKGALGLVFPSLEEGFGIPVAEAQAMRVPVIASRRHSLAEVADGSLEIDPEDHMDIADKITQLISDDELRAEVAEQGWLNSRRFTRELGAHGLIAAVNHVLQLRETEAGEAGGVDSLQAPVDRR